MAQDSVKKTITKKAEKELGEAAISQEVAFKYNYPEYENYQFRGDGMSQDIGVKSCLFEKTYLENNIQVFGGQGTEDSVTIVNESYSDLVIPKDTCNIELQLAAPTFVFNRSEVRALEARTAANLLHPNPNVKDIIRSYSSFTLPDVVCHRSMWALRCIYRRELLWAATVLFDSKETGISEICTNIACGMMGDSKTHDWWQRRLPTPVYEPKDSKYAKVNTYAITADEFPAFTSSDHHNDLRVCGLKVIIPYYVCQAPDLTYAGKYAQNRTQTKMVCHIGYVVGPFAFVSHNSDDVPFVEHEIQTSEKKPYHIPKTNQLSQSSLPGYVDKYIGLYFDTTHFSPYIPYLEHNLQKSVLGGPTVIGVMQLSQGCNWSTRLRPVADDQTGGIIANLTGVAGILKLAFNFGYSFTKRVNNLFSFGDIEQSKSWVLLHKQIAPFRGAKNTPRGNEPSSVIPVGPNGLLDCLANDSVSFYHTLKRSKLIKGISRCGELGTFFKRPYQTAVVGGGAGTPAALPHRFSGLNDNRNAASHKLSFRFDSIPEDVVGDGVRVDSMKKYIILTNDADEGDLLPLKDLSSKCFMQRGLVNLDSLATNQMNIERDSNMGMTTQMWHSSDTQEGIFKLSPKEKHTQIILNGVNNTPVYQFYRIHLSFFTKANCKREHPLSFLDFDCVAFNKIFKEITIRWKSNNSAGEQLCWKYDEDPEMNVFYSFFVSYHENFWPDSPVPTYEEWLVKPVIIFSPNSRAGRPVRKFTSFNTGGITLDATYRDGLTVDDVYSLFGEDYNWTFDPTIRVPHIANAFDTPADFREHFRVPGNAADISGQDAVGEYWFNPDASRVIRGRPAIPINFDDLIQMLSLLSFRVVMSNTQILWFAGVGIGGAVPCTVFVRAGGIGISTAIGAKK